MSEDRKQAAAEAVSKALDALNVALSAASDAGLEAGMATIETPSVDCFGNQEESALTTVTIKLMSRRRYL